MTAATPPLADFLLARIAEDEAGAQDALTVGEPWRVVEMRDGDGEVRAKRNNVQWVVAACDYLSHARLIAAHQPARVLAECEAKRRIVAGWHHFGEDEYADGMEEALRQVLCHLAAVYADHADYDEAWRP